MYNCTKSEWFCLQNELRNTKINGLIKWSIMRIFNEAEPPWSNSSDMLNLGQWISLPRGKMIRETLRTWERYMGLSSLPPDRPTAHVNTENNPRIPPCDKFGFDYFQQFVIIDLTVETIILKVSVHFVSIFYHDIYLFSSISWQRVFVKWDEWVCFKVACYCFVITE